METRNVLMSEVRIAEDLIKIFDQSPSLFGKPKIKIFHGREWFFSVSDDEIQPAPQESEKMDYIFMTAESLKKYSYHPVYNLDLRKVLEKYGTKDTKVIVFSCCCDCTDFVTDHYRDIVTNFLGRDCPVEYIVKKYFTDCLAID